MANVIITATHESGSTITMLRVAKEVGRTVSLLRECGYVKVEWKHEGSL